MARRRGPAGAAHLGTVVAKGVLSAVVDSELARMEDGGSDPRRWTREPREELLVAFCLDGAVWTIARSGWAVASGGDPRLGTKGGKAVDNGRSRSSVRGKSGGRARKLAHRTRMVGVAQSEKNRESLCLWVVAMRLAGICFGVSLVCLVSLVSLGGHGALAGTWQSPCCWVWALDGCWLLQWLQQARGVAAVRWKRP